MTDPDQRDRSPATGPSRGDARNRDGAPGGDRPRRIGRYALHREIASGGMARVHFATASGVGNFRKVVVVKRLFDDLARVKEVRELFLDEARLSARVAHAHVVQTLDVVEADGEVFIVMEYIHGESLHHLINVAHDPAPVAVASAIVSGILRGLHAAHQARDGSGDLLGIVHRDVSPTNVLVGADGVARVLDFGIARAAARSHVTREGVVKGKVAYMAPEQLHGEEVTAQADVYAAAVILWELLVGKRLFAGDSEAVEFARASAFTAPPPSELRDGVSSRLNRVVLRGLARDRTNRYESAEAMALALEEAAPPASPNEVGAWVKALAGPRLAERDAMRLECEREAERAADYPASARGIPKPMVALYTVLGAALALGIAGAGWWTLRRGDADQRLRDRAASGQVVAGPPASIDRGAPAPADASAPKSPNAVESAVADAPPESAHTPTNASPSDAGTPSNKREPPRRSEVLGARSAAKVDCDPPYVIDPSGRRKFKRECLSPPWLAPGEPK